MVDTSYSPLSSILYTAWLSTICAHCVKTQECCVKYYLCGSQSFFNLKVLGCPPPPTDTPISPERLHPDTIAHRIAMRWSDHPVLVDLTLPAFTEPTPSRKSTLLSKQGMADHGFCSMPHQEIVHVASIVTWFCSCGKKVITLSRTCSPLTRVQFRSTFKQKTSLFSLYDDDSCTKCWNGDSTFILEPPSIYLPSGHDEQDVCGWTYTCLIQRQLQSYSSYLTMRAGTRQGSITRSSVSGCNAKSSHSLHC